MFSQDEVYSSWICKDIPLLGLLGKGFEQLQFFKLPKTVVSPLLLAEAAKQKCGRNSQAFALVVFHQTDSLQVANLVDRVRSERAGNTVFLAYFATKTPSLLLHTQP